MTLSSGQAGKQRSESMAGPARPMKLPEVIPSIRLRQAKPFGNMHLHISVDPETGHEREVFARLGKGGDLANSDLEALCRLISLLLHLDGDIRTVEFDRALNEQAEEAMEILRKRGLIESAPP